jgi:hypothetical protein
MELTVAIEHTRIPPSSLLAFLEPALCTRLRFETSDCLPREFVKQTRETPEILKRRCRQTEGRGLVVNSPAS